MSIAPHILRILSNWGSEPPLATSEDRDILKGYASMAHGQGRATWVRLAHASTKEELERLIRGMVRAEEAHVWWGGSVSLVVQLFAVYAERWPAHRLPMADWIMANSTNHYIPFDRGGSRNHAEYEAYLRNMEARRIAQVRVEEEARIRKEQQRIERAEQHEQRLHAQERYLEDRARKIQALEQLPLEDRLHAMLAEEDRSLAYYPVSLVAEHEGAIPLLNPTLVDRLRQRIATASNREWIRWGRAALNGLAGQNEEPNTH
jgi:hypothetical protein